MKFKRWIAIGIVNALLICGALQIFGGNKAAAQTHVDNTTNLDVTPSDLIYLPLVSKNYPAPPTATFTPTFTPSPTPSPSRTPSPSPTASPSPTPSPTYNGIYPPICEKQYLPNKTESFSDSSGPVKHVLPNKIQHTMLVRIVTASANLKGDRCMVGQLVMVNDILRTYWEHYSNNSYNLYTDSAYTSFIVHVGEPIEYRAYAARVNCLGSITGGANYVEICGDPIP